MTKKYRTSRGKEIDLDALIISNETTPAVGNLNVNARGDELGPGGKVIRSKNERIRELNKLHTMVPDDVGHIPTSAADERERELKKEALIQKQKQDEMKKKEEEDRLKMLEEETANAPKVARPPEGGLAGALAKADSVEHKPIEPKQVKRKSGVKRL